MESTAPHVPLRIVFALAEAIAGPLRGSHLTPLPGHQVFWFAWRRFYPESRVWTGP